MKKKDEWYQEYISLDAKNRLDLCNELKTNYAELITELGYAKERIPIDIEKVYSIKRGTKIVSLKLSILNPLVKQDNILSSIERNNKRKLSYCSWTQADDHAYETSCGQSFCLDEGSPEDNEMVFCCYCGKHLYHTLTKE